MSKVMCRKQKRISKRIASIIFKMVDKVPRLCKKNTNDVVSKHKIGIFFIQRYFVKNYILILDSCFVSENIL